MKAIIVRRGKRVLTALRQSWPILVIASLVLLVLNQTVVIDSWQDSSQQAENQAQQSCPPPPMDYALVMSTEELNRVMLSRNWPILRGYEGRDVTAETHPADTLLLDRLNLNQKNMKKPLLRIRNKDGSVNARHDWKFEKIIHQTWKSEHIPGTTAPWVKKWLELHPDWSYVFWTDESSREFLNEYYPSLIPVYDSWSIPVQKADMFRLIALYAFGGIYADLDMEPLRPLDELRDWSSCILSREPDLQTYVMVNDLNFWGNNYTFTCNAFMACQSHHPFLHYLIGRITRMSPLVTGHSCPLAETILCSGPMFVSLSYGFYRRSIPQTVRDLRKEYDVICPKYEYFLPTFDSTRLLHAQNICRQKVLEPKQEETCAIWKERGYSNKPMNYSFTNHRWFHSYHFNMHKNRTNIRTLTDPIFWSPDDEEQHFYIEHV